MRKIKFLYLIIILLIFGLTMAKAQKKLKVFISVDMEGITDVTSFNETNPGDDYQYYRTLMTKEANAAIEGALEAGATEIYVRDAHNTARNIIPEMLNENAKLIREWAGSPFSMMEGINNSFSAVIFIGYHAKAGTRDAVLDHTMTGSILDLKVNNVSISEAGWNGLIAGYYDVPVVFVSGDKAICDQVKDLFGEIETFSVKEGVGEASINLHPDISRKMIKKGVTKALGRIKDFKPYKMKPPFTIQIDFKNEPQAYKAAWYPGAKRVGDWGVSLTSNDFFDLMRFFMLGR
jgi:D-amino peptidase